MKQTWWKESVVYQVYPRSFLDSNGDGIGDLKGITSKLDYLKNLGIDVIWICPMYKSPNADNGYDISDYHGIMEEFGTMDDFDELLEEVHKRGMKLILDLVINHTSDEHAWFVESRSSRGNPKRDWYIWRDGKSGREPNNWASIFGGSAWEYDQETGQYYMHIFSPKQPDLNWENPEVRNAVYEMVTWWLDKGIDGFRLDAISHLKRMPGLPDAPNPEHSDYVLDYKYIQNVDGIEEFLTEFTEQTNKKYDIMTVGEAAGVGIEDVEKWVGEENGYFNMIFPFEFLRLLNKDEDGLIDLPALKKVFAKWQTGVEGKGWNALFIENHDLPRRVSRSGNDQTYWRESAKMLGALYFLMEGTPFIYQGQEIGMTNVQFPSIEDYRDIGMINYYHAETEKGRPHKEVMEKIWRECRDNSRTPMQWDSSPMAGFTTAAKTWIGMNPNYKSINVQDQLNDPDSICQFYKKMIAIRKENPVFIYGTFELLMADHPALFVYMRMLDKTEALVLNNFSEEPASWKTPEGVCFSSSELILANYPEADRQIPEECILQPYETRVYLCEDAAQS